MRSDEELARWRKVVAAAGTLTAGGLIANAALEATSPSPLALFCAALLAVSGFGLTRRSVLVQILGRGVAWSLLLPLFVMLAVQLGLGRSVDLLELGLAGSLSVALLAARPSLGTRAARAEFAPHAWRRLFLTGATATTSTALVFGGGAIAFAAGSAFGAAAGCAALSALLLGSVVGVMRMRAWGVLLGGVAALACLAMVPFGSAGGIGLIIAASAPLLGFVAPVLLARAGLGAGSPARMRVATSELASPVRVAADDELLLEDESADVALPPRLEATSAAPTR